MSGRRISGASVLVLVTVVLAAACGGGSSKSASSATTVDANVTTTTGSGGTNTGNGNCFTTPGTQTARVRFVNLFTNATYPANDIDVYQGFGADDPCGKKLATVKFGAASDYIDVTASDSSGNWTATAFVGGTGKDHKIIDQSETWKGGEVVTIVFQGADPSNDTGLPPSAGGDQAFYETGTPSTPAAVTAVPGKAVIGAAATSLQYVVKDGAWFAGLVGGTGCLTSTEDTDSSKAEIGGTSLVQYPTAPGALKLGFYDAKGTCSGTPAIGPASFDAAAGSRTFVFAYGSDPKNLKLLVLPLAAS